MVLTHALVSEYGFAALHQRAGHGLVNYDVDMRTCRADCVVDDVDNAGTEELALLLRQASP
nr:hypothetical protein [Rhodococcus opacus]